MPTQAEIVRRVLERARRAAVDYYRLTGRPLGITGEIGESEAIRCLRLTLAPVRAPGYDAKNKRGQKIQIKTRCIPRSKKLGGQKLGLIKLDKEWDKVLLVHLDENLKPLAMYEAKRKQIEAALRKTKSRARARGALSLTEFIKIGRQVWSA